MNGEKRRIEETWTVQDLMRDLELEDRQVAVEVNEEIISRGHWAKRRFNSGDRVEIVHFVGGGEEINVR